MLLVKLVLADSKKPIHYGYKIDLVSIYALFVLVAVYDSPYYMHMSQGIALIQPTHNGIISVIKLSSYFYTHQ